VEHPVQLADVTVVLHQDDLGVDARERLEEPGLGEDGRGSPTPLLRLDGVDDEDVPRSGEGCSTRHRVTTRNGYVTAVAAPPLLPTDPLREPSRSIEHICHDLREALATSHHRAVDFIRGAQRTGILEDADQGIAQYSTLLTSESWS
jgi:hypothetical protein